MIEKEIQMYGMTVEDIEEQYLNSITAKFTGLEMVVAGILSDCQEMISLCSPNVPSPRTHEYLRKQMNIAKFIIFKMKDAKESV